MNSIMTRRSIRKYQDKPVEAEKLDRILRAAMQAPSAHNTQPWEFLVVTNPKDKEAVCALSPYAKPGLSAPVLIITLANMMSAGKETEQWWQQGLAAATQNILLQATQEGLGSLWLGYFPNADRVKGLIDYFHLPDYIIPFSVVCIGYPEKEVAPANNYNAAKIHDGKYYTQR